MLTASEGNVKSLVLTKKVEKIFGGMKNISYLCIVIQITDLHRD